MRFPRPRLSELRCMKEPYIRNMFIKNAAAFLLSIFVGVVAVIAAKTGTALLPVLFMALYFLVSAIGVAWNAAAGRYVVVRAAAVACEEQRDAVRQKRSVYRFIPVDEDGNYPFPFPVIHTDYFRTPTRSQSDDGPRRYRHSAGAQQERKREKKKGRNGAPRRNRLTKAQPGTYPTTKRRRKRAYDTKMRRMWERI